MKIRELLEARDYDPVVDSGMSDWDYADSLRRGPGTRSSGSPRSSHWDDLEFGNPVRSRKEKGTITGPDGKEHEYNKIVFVPIVDPSRDVAQVRKDPGFIADKYNSDEKRYYLYFYDPKLG